jgi:hypothetical protein
MAVHEALEATARIVRASLDATQSASPIEPPVAPGR